ncbi:hypothetical protein [Desulfolithobacter sp.]
MKRVFAAFLCLWFGTFPFADNAAASGDEVVSIIKQAVHQYEQGDYAGAASNLDYAAQMIRQKKGRKIQEALPEPMAGWQAEQASAQAVGSAMFGGGVTVSRTYTRGDAEVVVSIVTDSPLMQSMMMMVNNPMFAGADGGSLQIIKGHKAIVKYDGGDQTGEVSMVVGNKFMVTVVGDGVKREDLLTYAGAIDFGLLEKY